MTDWLHTQNTTAELVAAAKAEERQRCVALLRAARAAAAVEVEPSEGTETYAATRSYVVGLTDALALIEAME